MKCYVCGYDESYHPMTGHQFVRDTSSSDQTLHNVAVESARKNRELEQELTQLLNRHSAENFSGTPDFILAKFMLDSLTAYNLAVTAREDWRSS